MKETLFAQFDLAAAINSVLALCSAFSALGACRAAIQAKNTLKWDKEKHVPRAKGVIRVSGRGSLQAVFSNAGHCPFSVVEAGCVINGARQPFRASPLVTVGVQKPDDKPVFVVPGDCATFDIPYGCAECYAVLHDGQVCLAVRPSALGK